MTSCAIKICRNYKGRLQTTNKVSYHRIPTDSIIRSQWVDIIRKSRGEEFWKPSKTTVICSQHFREKDLYFANNQGRRRLKKEAVPKKALFLSSVNSDESDISDEDVGVTMEYDIEKQKPLKFKMAEKLEELAVQLFDAGAVRLGDIEAKVGRRTPIYFDLRVVVSHPRLMMAISRQLQALASEIPHDILCGVPYAALPFAAVMSVNSNTPMIMKRKETKLYATKKILEGVFEKEQKCLVVEDVVTSGGSLLETVTTLRSEGLQVTHAVVVLDREQGGASVLRANGVQMRSIYTMTNLVKILKDAGKISDETAEIVSDHIRECQFGYSVQINTEKA